jgi:hypothetical protein
MARPINWWCNLTWICFMWTGNWAAGNVQNWGIWDLAAKCKLQWILEMLMNVCKYYARHGTQDTMTIFKGQIWCSLANYYMHALFLSRTPLPFCLFCPAEWRWIMEDQSTNARTSESEWTRKCVHVVPNSIILYSIQNLGTLGSWLLLCNYALALSDGIISVPSPRFMAHNTTWTWVH